MYTGLESILRLLAMGQAKLKVKGIYKNGNLYSLKVRIPVDVVHKYPKGQTYLQAPLGTADYPEAIKRATPILQGWNKDWKAIRLGKGIPSGVIKAYPVGRDILDALGDEDSEAEAVDSRFIKEAERRARESAKKKGQTLTQDQLIRLAEPIYREDLKIQDCLNPAEIDLLVTKGHMRADLRLTDALRIYLETHKEGDKGTIKNMATYSIDGLVVSQGNLLLADPKADEDGSLTRQHLESWVRDMVKVKKLKTGTAARRLNQVKAILRQVFVVRQISNVEFLVDRLVVANAGKDAKETYSPEPEELRQILNAFKDDPLVRLLVYLGARIAEVSGLKIKDLHLNVKDPFISIAPNEIRGLKTANSERDVPVFGESLKALKAVIQEYSNGEFLLPQYAKERGANTASQTINKRLATKGFPQVKTHSFRHSLKDLLRNSGCTEALMDEIQGHGTQTISKGYGRGRGIEAKAKALARAYKLIPAK